MHLGILLFQIINPHLVVLVMFLLHIKKKFICMFFYCFMVRILLKKDSGYNIFFFFNRFGGIDENKCYNDIWCYDIRANIWTELTCTGFIPSARYNHGSALVDDVIYVFGGRTHDEQELGDLTGRILFYFKKNICNFFFYLILYLHLYISLFFFF